MSGRERQHSMASIVNNSYEHDENGKLVVASGENPVFLDLAFALKRLLSPEPSPTQPQPTTVILPTPKIETQFRPDCVCVVCVPW